MKMRTLLVATAMASLLPGCGGDSGSGNNVVVVTPTPTPTTTPVATPTPAPTPTPTPAAATNTTVTNLVADQKFNTPYGLLMYSRTAENYVSFTATAAGVNSSISYLAADQSYQVRNITGVESSTAANPFISFGAADRVAAESDAQFTTYHRVLGDFDFALQLLNPGTANGLIATRYSSIGFTRQRKAGPFTAAPTFTNVRYSGFAYGIETPESAYPAGIYDYSGVILGEATYFSQTQTTPVYRLTGTIRLQIGYNRDNDSGTLTLQGTDDRTGDVVDFGSFAVQTGPDGIQITGAIGTGSGEVAALPFGPAAEELGGTAGLKVTTPDGRDLYLALEFLTKR